MTKKIFRSILFTSLAALLISLAVAVGCQYYYFVNVREELLQTELNLAAKAVEDVGIGYLDDLDTDGLRFTLVDRGGTVLADTDADPLTMESHGNREEIIEALSNGKGESSRYSSTQIGRAHV